MRLIITDRTKIIYSMYRADELSIHRACCERATQPYSLGGGGTNYPGSRPADVTTRSPRMVAECLLTRSMLIKMYYHFMVCACVCTIVFTVRRLLSLFSLSNCINVFVCKKEFSVTKVSKNMDMTFRKYLVVHLN